MIEGKTVFLRAMEPSDIEFLYHWENDTSIWHLSNTLMPYSKDFLLKFIESARNDIYVDRQVRLMICLRSDNSCVGAIDIFEFEPHHQRAGLGILVSEKYRRNGIAGEALDLIIKHAFSHIGINQLFCNILPNNKASIALFRSRGFVKCALKKGWLKINGSFYDEVMFQLLKDNF